MRLARWATDAGPRSGFVIGETPDDLAVVPLPDGLDVIDLVRLGLKATLNLGHELGDTGAIPLDSVRLLTPIAPPSVRDFVAFEEHVEGIVRSVNGVAGVDAEWYEFPTFYFTNPHSLIATGDVMVPPATERLDFELEVGAVIGGVEGRDGTDLTPTEAKAHIFGYTIFNDWSARDIQSREMKVKLGPCKGKDFATTLGPWIVTADEFDARHDDEGFLPVLMTVAVNGVEIGRDRLSNMGWPFAELVAYASRNSRVVPGDVLGSGTAGSGCLAELWGRVGSLTPPPLHPGDEVVMTVEGVGEIRNLVGEPHEVPFIPSARARSRER
ncbi:fumarylacetoacetate hydrolase family protein [soil metagenome]